MNYSKIVINISFKRRATFQKLILFTLSINYNNDRYTTMKQVIKCINNNHEIIIFPLITLLCHRYFTFIELSQLVYFRYHCTILFARLSYVNSCSRGSVKNLTFVAIHSCVRAGLGRISISRQVHLPLWLVVLLGSQKYHI